MGDAVGAVCGVPGFGTQSVGDTIVDNAKGAVQVTLRWTPSATPNVYYWVWKREGLGSWTRFAFPVSGTSTVLQIPADRTFSFRVQANNLAGDSDFSNIATATPWEPTFEWARYSPRKTFLWGRTSKWLIMRQTYNCGGLPGNDLCVEEMQFRSTGGEYYWQVGTDGARYQTFVAGANYYRARKCASPGLICTLPGNWEWNSSPACQGQPLIYGIVVMCDPSTGIRMPMNTPPPPVAHPV